MAANIDDFTLISGADVLYDGLFHIKQPRLGDIREITYSQYQSYLSILLLKKSTLLGLLGIEDPQVAESIDLYTLLCAVPEASDALVTALSFFIREPVCCIDGQLYINQVPVGENVLEDLKRIIFTISYLNVEPEEKPKCADAFTAKILAKLQKGRAEMAKAKKHDQNMELPNLISAISARHNSYNLLNIWGLTVYQIYDQFARLNVDVQLSIYGQRWAAWGKEEFDTTMWFKNFSKKEV